MPHAELLKQDMEILLSHDFESMGLEDLRQAREDYHSLHRTYVDQFDTFEQSESQVQASAYLDYLIAKKEHEDDVVRVGDLFYTSWGYDQTNVEYWKVREVSKTGRTCKVVQVEAETVHGSQGRGHDSVTPNPEREYDRPLCKVKVEIGRLWDNRAKQHKREGELTLRGSVWYCNDGKHLQSLYRVDPTGRQFRSWDR